MMMSFTDNDGYHIGQFGVGSSAGATTINSAVSGDRFYFIGTPVYGGFGGLETIPRAGHTRLYVNDSVDEDRDGLGNELERALGLCSTTRFPVPQNLCPHAVTSQDTDRDGLPDGEEVLGYLGDNPDSFDDYPFPRLGANPLHKDMFVAVAWLTDLDPNAGYGQNQSPNLFGRNPFEQPVLFDEVANPSIQESAIDWVQRVRSAFLDGPAHHLHNPDGVDGISVHFDIGLDPTNPSDEAFYGILSNQIVHEINPKWVATFTNEPFVGSLFISVNGSQIVQLTSTPNARAIDFAVAVSTAISEHINANLIEFDDSDPNNIRVVYDTSVPGEHLEISIEGLGLSATDNINDTIIVTPELAAKGGEAAVRNHGGDALYLPAQLSRRTRYAVIASGGQASGGRLYSAIRAESVGHELGHTAGLSHGGHNQWLGYNPDTNFTDTFDSRGNEINCFPHYYSTMSYSFDEENHFRFSDLDRMVFVNPSNITEQDSFPQMNIRQYSGQIQGVSQTGELQTDFNIFSSPDGVDWNFNGELESSSTSTSGPINFSPKQSCGTFAFGRQVLYKQETISGLSIVGSLDIVRAGKYVYAFYIREDSGEPPGRGTIYYRRAQLGDQNSASCKPNMDNPLNYGATEVDSGSDIEGCLQWESEQTLTNVEKARHLSAYWWDNKIYIAYRSISLDVHVNWYQQTSFGILSFSNTQTLSTQRNLGKPELAIIYADSTIAGWSERLVVVFDQISLVGFPQQSPQQRYIAFFWNVKGNFERWFNFEATNSGPFSQLTGAGHPSLIAWPDPNNSYVAVSARVTCGVFPNDNNFLRFYCFDPIRLVWEDRTDAAFGGPIEVSGESAVDLAFRNTRRANGALLDPGSAEGNFQLTIPRRLGNSKEVLPAELWISQPIDITRSPLQWTAANPMFRWQDYFINQWFYTVPGTNIPMYEDSVMGGMFALSLDTIRPPLDPQTAWLRFYPHADGTPNIKVWAGSDFRVMEDYLCLLLPGHSNAQGQAVVPCVHNEDQDEDLEEHVNIFE